jgi:DHA1 family multidrug resistance protein-like MFS transporter
MLCKSSLTTRKTGRGTKKMETGEKGGWKNLFFICLAQCGVNFSFNFMFAFLPFYLNDVSSYSIQNTLLWTGAILGSTSMCIAFSGPFWGSLTHRVRPKLLFVAGMAVHSLTFVAMGFTTSLPLFLFLRILQGVLGGTSTIGLIMISSGRTGSSARDMGLFQSSVTLGQLLGPPVGTFAVTLFGYRGAFLAAAAVFFAMFLLAHLYVANVPCLPRAERGGSRRAVSRPILATWLLCVAAQIQLMFLPSILPDVFRGLRLDQTSAIHWAGVLITLYTITSLAGTYVWCSLSNRVGATKMIGFLLVGGAVLQAALLVPNGIVGFSAVRMAQTFLIAAVIPLSLALFAGEAKGFTMGFLYSSRFVGNAAGPVMATSILAFSNLPFLCLAISAFSLATLGAFHFARSDSNREAEALKQ